MMSLKRANPKHLCFMVLDVKPVDVGGHTGMLHHSLSPFQDKQTTEAESPREALGLQVKALEK